MLRFVAGPDGTVVPDLRRRLPGRGVWVTATRAALTQAVRRNAFARSLKQGVRASAALPALTERLLEQAALDALSIAHKAGTVEIGFSRVEGSLAKHDIAAFIHASDAAADGVRKLAAAARRRYGEGAGPPVVDLFTSTQLDLAFGRPNVIHAALRAGAAGERFLARVCALQRFRGAEELGRDDGS